MNILDLIKRDHKEVSDLFHKFEITPMKAERDALRKIITFLLTKHADAEELIFYPALAVKEETNKFVEHSKEEHTDIRTVLNRFSFAKGEEYFNELKEAVEHHVQEEETEIFKAVESSFTNLELSNLGNRFIAFK